MLPLTLSLPPPMELASRALWGVRADDERGFREAGVLLRHADRRRLFLAVIDLGEHGGRRTGKRGYYHIHEKHFAILVDQLRVPKTTLNVPVQLKLVQPNCQSWNTYTYLLT